MAETPDDIQIKSEYDEGFDHGYNSLPNIADQAIFSNFYEDGYVDGRMCRQREDALADGQK